MKSWVKSLLATLSFFALTVAWFSLPATLTSVIAVVLLFCILFALVWAWVHLVFFVGY